MDSHLLRLVTSQKSNPEYHMPLMIERSRSKPEVELQYFGRLFYNLG